MYLEGGRVIEGKRGKKSSEIPKFRPKPKDPQKIWKKFGKRGKNIKMG